MEYTLACIRCYYYDDGLEVCINLCTTHNHFHVSHTHTHMHTHTYLYSHPSCIPQINQLRRVLVAFSWYDQQVGYCQGLNRLAAIALLFLKEEDAFWCLVAIVQHLLPPDYYSRTLLGSQTDQACIALWLYNLRWWANFGQLCGQYN